MALLKAVSKLINTWLIPVSVTERNEHKEIGLVADTGYVDARDHPRSPRKVCS